MAEKERSYSLRGWEPFTNTDKTFQVAEKPSPRGSGIDYVVHDEAGALILSGWIAGGLTPMQRKKAIGTDIGRASERVLTPAQLLEFLERQHVKPNNPELSLTSVILPDSKIAEGVLIKSTSALWTAIVRQLGADWTKAFEIDPTTWEEIIAGAFKRDGYDEVILTPRTGDHGRDVIAIRKGIGSVKIIGSVKAYHPGLLVSYDHVRSLIGVMTGEQNTSKGIITTTSDFPPKLGDDPFIAPFMPYRLELVNGNNLQSWLKKLVERVG